MESDSQSPKMQRMLELHLSNYQVMISEIEQNIHYLLENCEDIEDYQEQIDALSSKLEEVKVDLEDLQMMLEDTSLEEEGLDDEKEISENKTDLEDHREIETDPWHKNAIGDRPSSTQSLCQLLPPIEDHEISGSESPDSPESIPLEWDHSADLGSPFPYEEAGKYYSALSASEAHPWCSPDSPVFRKHRYNWAEMAEDVLCGPETSTPYKLDYDTRESQLVPGDLHSRVYNPVTTKSSPAVKKTHITRTAVGRNSSSSTRDERHLQPIQAVSRSPSFFNRVLRAALPFLVVTLLLLLLACTVLYRKEPYSCTNANNFARSFHFKLQYPNGPPPV